MSAIEKLFVQIFDQKRQIVQQLNHHKQLYDQHLASKLLIHGIAPPPWLLNSDKFASSSFTSSDPKDMNKEDLMTGFLLSCLQLASSYSNASHLYGKPVQTAAHDGLPHTLLNATGAGHKHIDDERPRVLPQCTFRCIEDTQDHIAESPQDRVVSETFAQLDQSLLVADIKSDYPNLNSSLEKQHLSCKEEEFKCLADKPAALNFWLPSSGDSPNLVLAREEPFLTVENVSGKESDAVVNKLSSVGRCADFNLSTDNFLLEKQDASCREGNAKEPDSLCDKGDGSIFVRKWVNAQNNRGIDFNLTDKVENFADILVSSPTTWHQQVPLREETKFDYFGGSPSEDMNSVGKKGNDPVPESSTLERKLDSAKDVGIAEGFEFIELPNNTIERARFMEQLCRSASLGVPLSQFCASYRPHDASDDASDVCHSVPNEVLAHADLWITSALNMNTSLLLDSSYNKTENELDSKFQGKQYFDYLPFHKALLALNFKGACKSPVSKAVEGYTSRTCCSNKQDSSIKELTCFPIEEGNEEDEDANVMDHTCEQEIILVTESVCDTSQENVKHLPSDPALRRGSLESAGAEISFSGSSKQGIFDPEFTCFPIKERGEQDANAAETTHKGQEKIDYDVEILQNISEKNINAFVLHHAPKCGSSESANIDSVKIKKNNKSGRDSQNHPSQSGCLKQGKENQKFSLGTNCIKKHSKTLNTRFSKQRLSAEKSSLSTMGESFSEKEAEPKNIVSDIKSFLPLVQKKQAVAGAPGKRQVRMKAAEAAKQLAENKENECKQRQVMLKLERARLEQENLRQLEVTKKAKAGERKKRNDETVARRRHGEEEERIEKERKKKRAREAQNQQRGQDEKLPMDRENSRFKPDERTHGKMDVNAEVKAVAGKEEEERGTRILAKSSVSPSDDGVQNVNDLKMSSDPCKVQKVVETNTTGCSTPKTVENDYSLVSDTIPEESYEISPYQCSDDEGEEEDDLLDKIVPAWASNSSVALALSSLSNLDPVIIFPSGSFCSLNEVVLPRRLVQQ